MTDDRHDPDAVLHVAGLLYAAVVGSRPNLLDNAVTTERERLKLIRACVADAESLVEIALGLDEPATVPVPPVVLGDQDGAA